MTPTLLSGDLVLVRHGAAVRPGSIVLARFRSRPELLVLKRAVAAHGDGWLLASDNARAGSDSRQYGVADVQACAVWIWHRPLAGAGSAAVGEGVRSAARRRLGERALVRPVLDL